MKENNNIEIIRVNVHGRNYDGAIAFLKETYGKAITSSLINAMKDSPYNTGAIYLRLNEDKRGFKSIVSSTFSYRDVTIVKTIQFPLKYPKILYMDVINKTLEVKIEDERQFSRFHNHSILNYSILGVLGSKTEDEKLEYLGLMDSVPVNSIISSPIIVINPDDVILSSASIAGGTPLWDLIIEHNDIYSSVPIYDVSKISAGLFEEVFGFNHNLVPLVKESDIVGDEISKKRSFEIAIINGVPVNVTKLSEMADLTMNAACKCLSKSCEGINPQISWKIWKSEEGEMFIGTQWLRSVEEDFLHFSAKSLNTGESFVVKMLFPTTERVGYLITVEKNN